MTATSAYSPPVSPRAGAADTAPSASTLRKRKKKLACAAKSIELMRQAAEADAAGLAKPSGAAPECAGPSPALPSLSRSGSLSKSPSLSQLSRNALAAIRPDMSENFVVRWAEATVRLSQGSRAHMLGLMAGAWHVTQSGCGRGLAAVKAGARGGRKPKDALWKLYRLTEQSRDKTKFQAWLKLNGIDDPTNESHMETMRQVAAEIVEASKPHQPVILQDHNLPLLHPFAHDESEIYAAYLKRMEQNGTYASGTEARAVADALNVRIAVYQPNAGDPTAELQAVYGPEDAGHMVHIRHDGGAHWEGILRRSHIRAELPLAYENGDILLKTAGDGNCLFHALARSLRATGHPSSQVLGYLGLRRLAVSQMEKHPGAYPVHVLEDVNVARAALPDAFQDKVDAQAVEAITRSHRHRPWDATWEHLAAHVDDVQNFSIGDQAPATSQAMHELMIDLLRRMERSVEAGALTLASFQARLTDIAAARATTVDRILTALSPWQRSHLLTVFRRPSTNATLEEVEAAAGRLFECLTFVDRMHFSSPAQLTRLVARNLRDPKRRLEFIENLTQELDATCRDNERDRALTRLQWEGIAADPDVRAATAEALTALRAGLPVEGDTLPPLHTLEQSGAWQPAKWVTLYRLMAITAPGRDAWLAALQGQPAPTLRLLAWAVCSDAARNHISKASKWALFQRLN